MLWNYAFDVIVVCVYRALFLIWWGWVINTLLYLVCLCFGMRYYHGVLHFTEMYREEHFMYYVTFIQSSLCLLLLPRALHASCVMLPCSVSDTCLVVYLHFCSLGNYSSVSTVFVSIVLWFFINLWHVVIYKGDVVTVTFLSHVLTVTTNCD
jgi:hypothetical protein